MRVSFIRRGVVHIYFIYNGSSYQGKQRVIILVLWNPKTTKNAPILRRYWPSAKNTIIQRRRNGTLNKRINNLNRSITTSTPPSTCSPSPRTASPTKIPRKACESPASNYPESLNVAEWRIWSIGYRAPANKYLVCRSAGISPQLAIKLQRPSGNGRRKGRPRLNG